MNTTASQFTSLTSVYSTVYSDADQRKHQSSASLAFVWGNHRDRWIPRTKGQLRGKCFHLMTLSCMINFLSCCTNDMCYNSVWIKNIFLPCSDAEKWPTETSFPSFSLIGSFTETYCAMLNAITWIVYGLGHTVLFDYILNTFDLWLLQIKFGLTQSDSVTICGFKNTDDRFFKQWLVVKPSRVMT